MKIRRVIDPSNGPGSLADIPAYRLLISLRDWSRREPLP